MLVHGFSVPSYIWDPTFAALTAAGLRVLRYEIRRGSGGEGKYKGGDGIRRDVQVLVDAQTSLITERRKYRPYGLVGGGPGSEGENYIFSEDGEIKLPGKGTSYLKSGDILSIRTPGGGGFGRSDKGDN